MKSRARRCVFAVLLSWALVASAVDVEPTGQPAHDSHSATLQTSAPIRKAEPATPAPEVLKVPQWTTSSRLLKTGESIEFAFFIPAGIEPGELCIFPNYLEKAEPGAAFSAGEKLDWLNRLEMERLKLVPVNGKAVLSYLPKLPGNYLARWRTGAEIFYRYFSVIADDYVVIRFGGYHELNTSPTLHATGIPMDFPLPVAKYTTNDPLVVKFLVHQRLYGDAIVPQFADAARLSSQERAAQWGAELARIRGIVSDPNDLREARIEMLDGIDPGYVQSLTDLGIVSHFGLQMANDGPWLGMPEFPYFASSADLRKTSQVPSGLVTHQWDFCTGWHFLGPQSWHYSISGRDSELARKCLYRGVLEGSNCARISGHFAYFGPLYDGNLRNTPDMQHFVERYQRFIAFEIPKEFKVVFTRSIDLADYYRRHYAVTPQTVFVSKTDHIFYDMHWHNLWAGRHELVTRERLPWFTRISTIQRLRKTDHGAKDPMSYEFMVVEDQKRSIRFERESPNPIWWNDYSDAPQHASPTWTETPDVDFVESSETTADNVGDPPGIPRWQRGSEGWTIKMKALTKKSFSNYAIALWGLPGEFARDPDPRRITTSVGRFLLARNTDGEYHLVLFFDLKPDLQLSVKLKTDR